MTDATERLVNLALFLASNRGPVTAEQIRSEVAGYPLGQTEAAFLRMFERDKEDLRAAGLVVQSSADGDYVLDTSSTFAKSVTLTAEEHATLAAVASAFADDASFPLAEELRLALAKLATDPGGADANVTVRLADGEAQNQGAVVSTLDAAMSALKRVSFSYVNALGEHKHHVVEPFGLFIREGRWYLVGRDCDLDEVRVYTANRVSDLEVNDQRPKTPDFVRPADFDIAHFIGLPFQYGDEPFEATLLFDAACAWKARSFETVSGRLEQTGGGAVWRVKARNRRSLLSWVVANGPGIQVISPGELRTDLLAQLARVEASHRGGGPR